jgi:hypothetical protein
MSNTEGNFKLFTLTYTLAAYQGTEYITTVKKFNETGSRDKKEN